MQDVDTLVASVRPELRPQVAELARNVMFMRKKLAETRADLANQQVVIEYNNGGGQTGVRKNPAFDAYEALLRTYQSALGCLREMLGLQAPAAPGARKSDLAQMRSKFRVVGE